MEEVVGSHPAVAECAVFAVPDALKGEVPVGLVVLKDGEGQNSEAQQRVCAELVKLVRDRIGAVASFRQVCRNFEWGFKTLQIVQLCERS